MEAGKRAAGDALQPANGDLKRARSAEDKDKSRPSNSERECGRGGRLAGRDEAQEAAQVVERRPNTLERKEKPAADPEEELMLALEADIEAGDAAVERVGVAALATEEDDDYDESDGEEEEEEVGQGEASKR